MCSGILLWFLFVFPWWLMMLSIFLYVNWPFVYLWKNVYSKSIVIFKWVAFLLLRYKRSLFTLDAIPLWDMIYKYSHTFYGLCFHFLVSNLWSTEVFNFDEDQFIFSFVACCLDVIFKRPLPKARTQTFTPLFSSKSFIILAITFGLWSILLFVYQVRKGSNLILLNVYPVVLIPIVKKILIFPLNGLSTLSKIKFP